MSFAKAAELNHYPGPKHVLELADKLQLSDEQRRLSQTVFEDMKSKAVNLGKQLVEKEQSLDSGFVDAKISTAELVQLVTEISVLHGKIRAVHLQAHVTQRAALTADQLMRYDAFRGYQGSGTHGQHDGH